MMKLTKQCPICKHTWILKYEKGPYGDYGIVDIFLRADFTMAMFNHLQTHTNTYQENPKCYEYNKGV